MTTTTWSKYRSMTTKAHPLSVIEIIHWEGLRVRRLKDYSRPQPTDITTKESWRLSDICGTTHSCQVQMEYDNPRILIEISILYAWLSWEWWINLMAVQWKINHYCSSQVETSLQIWYKKSQKGENLHEADIEMWNRTIKFNNFIMYLIPLHAT